MCFSKSRAEKFVNYSLFLVKLSCFEQRQRRYAFQHLDLHKSSYNWILLIGGHGNCKSEGVPLSPVEVMMLSTEDRDLKFDLKSSFSYKRRQTLFDALFSFCPKTNQ